MKYYEAHITMEFDPRFKPHVIGSRDHVEKCVQAYGWTFSAIDEDPYLGKGVKCYATKHYPFRIHADAVLDVVKLASKWLQEDGITVIREKLELVIYDSKQKGQS